MSPRLLSYAAAGLLSALALGDLATSRSSASDEQWTEAEIGEIVRAYLLENPEVILEAVERYQDDQVQLVQAAAEETALDYLPELLSEPTGHVIPARSGNSNVVVIEFFDYNCGTCRVLTDFTFSLHEENDDLKLILQELPVISPTSREAALISLAAVEDPQYLALHRAMMGAETALDSELASTIAREIGIAEATIESATVESGVQLALHDRIDRSVDIASNIGIDGTPAYIIATLDGSFLKLVPGVGQPQIDRGEVLRAIEEARKLARRKSDE